MSGDDLRGFIVYSEDRYHAVAVFRKADSKTWTVRCFRRNDFLAWVLKKRRNYRYARRAVGQRTLASRRDMGAGRAGRIGGER